MTGPTRTIINLAPAELRKDAGAFDLPVALLLATGQSPWAGLRWPSSEVPGQSRGRPIPWPRPSLFR